MGRHIKTASVLGFMYLRAILCTFQISVDFYYVPVVGRGGERGWGVNILEDARHSSELESLKSLWGLAAE
jgi:hypothetical protein